MKRTILVAAVGALLLGALPAAAATRYYRGTVGSDFIRMEVKPTKSGTVKIWISDQSPLHNFHLTGPGVDVKTSLGYVGLKVFTVTLKRGKYTFVCDAHKTSMKGSFTIAR